MNVSSKVLVYEHDADAMDWLKGFFKDHSLIGLRAEQEGRIQDVLKSNIDLGAIFVSDKIAPDLVERMALVRAELPIFVRVSSSDSPIRDMAAVTASFRDGDSEKLEDLINRYIFNRHYPTELIREVERETCGSLNDAFQGVAVHSEPPYLIRDRIIYGELFSLIRLESDWCRGYMMLQIAEDQISRMIERGAVPGIESKSPDMNFRIVNGLLSELTNSVWGRLKSCFLPGGSFREKRFSAEIPSVINHGRNYISFGTDDPKLCFKYTLRPENGEDDPAVVYQKFAFHLRWEPESMEAVGDQVNTMVEEGGLVFL